MSSISDSFGAIGNGTSFFVKDGDSIDYSVSGTFVATVILERSDNNGQAWELVESFTAAASSRIDVKWNGAKSGVYRFRCTAYTSGTANVHISDVFTSIDGPVTTGIGSKNGNTVTAEELSAEVIHKTILRLNSTPISIASASTGNGVGGTKIYEMPAGYIHFLGSVSSLSIAVETEADFTDGTPEGDIGIGTVAPANANALGTDATDDNIGTATAFTMADYAATADVPPELSLNVDGTSTPVSVYVNALIDAADIDDDTTTNLLVSGTVELNWIKLGDY